MDPEEGIDGLFGLPPEEFIAARDQLARQLKAGGDAAGAKRVSALRRPTVAAWAVNQAARERPELVRELLEAGDLPPVEFSRPEVAKVLMEAYRT